MYKVIITIILAASVQLNAQLSDLPKNNNGEKISHAAENLIVSVSSFAGNYNVRPDLSDFRTKAEYGLGTMYPGSILRSLKCEKLIDFSQTVYQSFQKYLTEVYEDDFRNTVPRWYEDIYSSLSDEQNQFGIIVWDLEIEGASKQLKSVAVFDKNSKVLYDTKLADFAVLSEIDFIHEREENLSDATESIQNQNSQTKSRSLLLEGTFGSVMLHYQARVTSIVSPYITASTNDAEFNYYTEFIDCWRGTTTGIPPNGEPFLYFGTLGSYALLYMNSSPAISPITITGGSNDRFNTGLYNISGANGHNWSFSFDFSVDFPGGGIGITPVSQISSLSLSAVSNSSINMLNYLYNNNIATGDIRAIFFDGGSLNGDNFSILTGSGAGEIGKINFTSKLRAGYTAPNISGTIVPNFWSETSTAFNFSVEYLRGDHILQPDYQLTSTNYNIQIGQLDTLKARITNNSHAVKLEGGNISISVPSLGGILTLLSPATLPIGSIDTSSFKEFKFIVVGNSNGIATPQASITSMNWELPVPPDITINDIVSINANIEVGPPNKTLTLTMPLQGFYDAAGNTMAADTARVYLRNGSSPYSVIDSSKAYLSINSEGTFLFNNANNLTQYYIQTKHRNSVETWSKTTQQFISSVLVYNFSTSASQAYGDNLIQVDTSPLKFAVYSGDVNQDETIDLSDITLVYNDANYFAAGYVVTDLTGDNFVDLTDLTIAYNNSNNFVGVIRP